MIDSMTLTDTLASGVAGRVVITSNQNLLCLGDD
jgi:hypothetical protein